MTDVDEIAIGIPATESVYARFVKSFLEDLRIPTDVPRKVVVGSVVHTAHNDLVKWFLEETHARRLLLLETDHQFPPNLLERVRNYTEPVTGALYYGRGDPHMPLAFVPNPHQKQPDGEYVSWINDDGVWAGDWKGGKLTPIWPSLEEEWRRLGQLQRVCVVPMGCTAIRRDVLEDWPAGVPYFLQDYYDGSIRTDDVYFCHQVVQQGHHVYLDCGVELSHMALTLITHETYRERLRRRAEELELVPQRRRYPW